VENNERRKLNMAVSPGFKAIYLERAADIAKAVAGQGNTSSEDLARIIRTTYDQMLEIAEKIYVDHK
jgi:hypothetical protein